MTNARTGGAATAPDPPTTPAAAEVPPPHDDVLLPGGEFTMGDAFSEGYLADGETPLHQVRLRPFRIDATPVTITQFAAFVEATGYRTEAERAGVSFVFHQAVAADRADILGTAASAPWWLNASWES